MHGTCVARACRRPVRMNRMHRTQSDHTSLNLLSLVIQSNQACFDHQIRETYTKHSVGAKTWMFTIYMARQTGEESRSRIAFSICTSQFYLPNNGRESPKLVSKMTLMKRNTTFLLKNILSGKTGLPFHMFRCSQKFSAGTNKKVAFHLLSNRNFWKRLVVFDLRLLIEGLNGVNR